MLVKDDNVEFGIGCVLERGPASQCQGNLCAQAGKKPARCLELNNRVHYGEDTALRMEYGRAMRAASDKFYAGVPILQKWYDRHLGKKGDDPRKVASEIYVGIVGQPQLFVEGNHRTGSLIASWIDMSGGKPPFVLSHENAIDYFEPSHKIKHFKPLSNWRGERKLPKYHKVFREYWEKLIDDKYVIKD